MRILKILNHDEFEVEGDLAVGDLICCNEILAIVTSIYQEESEYSEYIDRLETEDIKRFLPDLVEGKRVARCLALCNTNLGDVVSLPEVGAKVDRIENENLRNLHLKDGGLKIPYLIKLLKTSNIEVARRLVLRLMDLIPEERDLLEIILAEIEYNRMRGIEL